MREKKTRETVCGDECRTETHRPRMTTQRHDYQNSQEETAKWRGRQLGGGGDSMALGGGGERGVTGGGEKGRERPGG